MIGLLLAMLEEGYSRTATKTATSNVGGGLQ